MVVVVVVVVLLLPISIRFCYHPCFRIPVERDGFKQFCSTFLLHIWFLCGLHILLSNVALGWLAVCST